MFNSPLKEYFLWHDMESPMAQTSSTARKKIVCLRRPRPFVRNARVEGVVGWPKSKDANIFQLGVFRLLDPWG